MYCRQFTLKFMSKRAKKGGNAFTPFKKEIFMNDIEVELRKLYLRHVDEEKQAELNL